MKNSDRFDGRDVAQSVHLFGHSGASGGCCLLSSSSSGAAFAASRRLAPSVVAPSLYMPRASSTATLMPGSVTGCFVRIRSISSAFAKSSSLLRDASSAGIASRRYAGTRRPRSVSRALMFAISSALDSVVEIRADGFDERHARRINPRGRIEERQRAKRVGPDAGPPPEQADGGAARAPIVGRPRLLRGSRAAGAVYLHGRLAASGSTRMPSRGWPARGAETGISFAGLYGSPSPLHIWQRGQ